MTSARDLQNAHEAYQSGDLDQADTIIATVLESEPGLAKAFQLKTLVALKRGDIQTADQAINEAVKLAPDDAEILNTHGNVLKYTGRILQAVQAYKESLKIAPNYLMAAQNLGELYLMEKDPVQAAAVFETALTHHQNHPVMMQGLLYALKDAQQNEPAMALLSQMPQSPALALSAGQLLAANDQSSQARNAFLQALSHAPSAIMAFRNLIQIAWLQGGLDAGRAELDTLIQNSPDTGFLYTHGADLLAEMGDLNHAGALLDACEKKFGPQAEISLERAKLCIRSNTGAEAFKHAEAALKLRPGDPAILAEFARAALMTEQYTIALEASRHMQTRAPNQQFWLAIEATALRGMGQDHTRLYDYARFVKAYDLDPPPEYDTLSDFLSQLKADLNERHKTKFHPIAQSLRGGTQTSADLRFADSRVIQDFFQALEAPIKDYLSQIGTAPDHPLTRRNNGAYRLSGAWSVKLSGDGFHVNHVHPEGWISSSFYVDVPDGTADDPENKGWIKFGEPPFDVPGMSYEHIIAPKAGSLVLFPSYMWHGTVPIAKGETRMTLPFDAVPAWGT